MNAQKLEISFPEVERSWIAIINYVDRSIAAGHTLPWSPGPTLPLDTPYGRTNSGVGLFDSKNHLVLHCNDSASAAVLARHINEEFAE